MTKMKVHVELPQPIEIAQKDSIEIFLPDAGGAFITIQGDGTVIYQGNGLYAPPFSLNLIAISKAIKGEVKHS